MVEIKTQYGAVTIKPMADSRFIYHVKDLAPGVRVESTTFKSSYGEKIAEAIINMEEFPTDKIPRLVRELLRDNKGSAFENSMKYYTLGFLPETDFVNKRILDFGCGCGSSTIALSRILPESHIIGLDRMEDCIEVCNLKKSQLGIENVSFIVSREDTKLPEDLGQMDFCIMCAVYEHLLPLERRSLLHDIWSKLSIGGTLFIVQTPHRYAPFGTHGARVPLLNYLPDRIAFPLDRLFYREFHGKFADEEILRAGFRGGSKGEVQRILEETPNLPRFVNPTRLGIRDTIDLWILTRNLSHCGAFKKIYGSLCRNLKSITGITIEPYLNLAIQKTDHK
jgi:2-polyprenyl-3-methyl-5-hydroxy-6-metoxy-1,4-benzoquinol methylase